MCVHLHGPTLQIDGEGKSSWEADNSVSLNFCSHGRRADEAVLLCVPSMFTLRSHNPTVLPSLPPSILFQWA